jgi:putative toxin-antitoxin system antitoxin component (TIGR02293 family)
MRTFMPTPETRILRRAGVPSGTGPSMLAVLSASEPRTAYRVVPGSLDGHDQALAGLPAAQVQSFLESFRQVPWPQLMTVLGISQRTLDRALASQRALDTNATDRVMRLHRILVMAMDTLGSREAAESWLAAPALGLEGRRPLDLLQSTDGTELVKSLLVRMEYGVYS